MESDIWQAYPHDDVIPIAVGIGMTPADWYYAYEPASLSYPLLCDVTSSVYSDYYYDGFVPLNYVIDQDGYIRYRDSGYDIDAILDVVDFYLTSDLDGDGHRAPEDCDDTDPTIHPCAYEICGDGIDQDCSGSDRACGHEDELEPNDDPSEAHDLGPLGSGAAVQGYLCSTGSDGYSYTGDHDYFRFSTSSVAGGVHTLTLDWANMANFDLWLYQADGTTLVTKDTTLDKPVVLEPSLAAGTEYVMLVVGYSGYTAEYTVTIEPPGGFTLELDASYGAGTLNLDYSIGTPETATWSNYLILISPSVQVIPLWSISLPALDPPLEIPISFPFPSLGTVGIFTGLFTGGGPQATVLEWVGTKM